jgi:hypothetical protein
MNWKIFIDIRIVKVAQLLRDKFGSITINNDYLGGSYNYSGVRPFDCKIGAKFSAHKFGRGLDLKFKEATPEEVQAYILQNESLFLNTGLTRLEDAAITKTWLHIDCTYTGLNNIHIFKP